MRRPRAIELQRVTFTTADVFQGPPCSVQSLLSVRLSRRDSAAIPGTRCPSGPRRRISITLSFLFLPAIPFRCRCLPTATSFSTAPDSDCPAEVTFTTHLCQWKLKTFFALRKAGTQVRDSSTPLARVPSFTYHGSVEGSHKDPLRRPVWHMTTYTI